MDYSIKLTRDEDGSLLATSVDFPELVTFGDDREDALRHAVDALEEIHLARLEGCRDESATARFGIRPYSRPTNTTILLT